jgi:hypothetical protein
MQNAECKMQNARPAIFNLKAETYADISKNAASVAVLVHSTTGVVFSAGKFIAFATH